MTDTLFADISEFNPLADDRYPYRVISIRSNDGTYQDKHFANNLAWVKGAILRGKLDCFLVYFVFEPNWQDTLKTFKAMVGVPHQKMAVIIDVETWSGRLSGDHSDAINQCRNEILAWLRANRSWRARVADLVLGRQVRRIVRYGNRSDLSVLHPRPWAGCRTILAQYGSDYPLAGKIAHQFSDHYQVPPFGYCDINSADGLAPLQLAQELGLYFAPQWAVIKGLRLLRRHPAPTKPKK